MSGPPLIGTAGWSIPSEVAGSFPGTGSHLERYAARMSAAEINSSFHRPHRQATYRRWAESTPPGFRFSVKLPKEISHRRRLVDAAEQIDLFVDQAGGLGARLAVVLVQLPPSLAFDGDVAAAFFDALHQRLGGGAAVACEPRHASWFGEEAEAWLVDHRIARVAADPVRAAGGERPGGWRGLRYHRLHGSPRVYHSSYERPRLEALAATIAADDGAGPTWCIFDNTAAGAAAGDALYLQSLLAPMAR